LHYCKPLEDDTHYGSEADFPERQRHNNEFEGTRSNRLWCPYHQFGITGTHDAAIGYGGEAGEVCRAYRELEAEDNLDLRVYLTIIEEQYQIMLGALSAAAKDVLDKENMLETMLGIIPKFKDENKKAFEMGYGMVTG
jgi:hypothetical protein